MKNLKYNASKYMKVVLILAIGTTMSFMVKATDDDDLYVFRTIGGGGAWKQCEPTREGAIKWARISMKEEAYSDCRELGPGWSFRKISFDGYEQAIPCEGGKSFKAQIERASVVCKHLK